MQAYTRTLHSLITAAQGGKNDMCGDGASIPRPLREREQEQDQTGKKVLPHKHSSVSGDVHYITNHHTLPLSS